MAGPFRPSLVMSHRRGFTIIPLLRGHFSFSLFGPEFSGNTPAHMIHKFVFLLNEGRAYIRSHRHTIKDGNLGERMKDWLYK